MNNIIKTYLLYVIVFFVSSCTGPKNHHSEDEEPGRLVHLNENQDDDHLSQAVNNEYVIVNADERLQEIRELYSDMNSVVKNNPDHYEIIYHTAGSDQFINLHFDEGKAYAEVSYGDEFWGSKTELYIIEDTIQFLFSKTYKLIDHWGEEIVRFRNEEIRIYFFEGIPFKALKKEFVGIVGQDDDFDMNDIPNINADFLSDPKVRWTYHKELINNLIILNRTLRIIQWCPDLGRTPE